MLTTKVGYSVTIIAMLFVAMVMVYFILVAYTAKIYAPQRHRQLAARLPNPEKVGTAIIYGMVRDGMPQLTRSLENMQEVASLYQSVRFVILENGSVDGTREALEAWRAVDDRVVLIDGDYTAANASVDEQRTKEPLGQTSTRGDRSRGPVRIARYVVFRNQLHRAVLAQINTLAHDDLQFVSMDLDQNRTIDLQALQLSATSMRADPSLAVSSALGHVVCKFAILTSFLYDSYAYCNVNGSAAYFQHHSGSAIGTPVRSNFGGMAIYRDSDAFRTNFYSLDQDPDVASQVLCEHIGFHDRLLVAKSTNRHILGFETFIS